MSGYGTLCLRPQCVHKWEQQAPRGGGGGLHCLRFSRVLPATFRGQQPSGGLNGRSWKPLRRTFRRGMGQGEGGASFPLKEEKRYNTKRWAARGFWGRFHPIPGGDPDSHLGLILPRNRDQKLRARANQAQSKTRPETDWVRVFVHVRAHVRGCMHLSRHVHLCLAFSGRSGYAATKSSTLHRLPAKVRRKLARAYRRESAEWSPGRDGRGMGT